MCRSCGAVRFSLRRVLEYFVPNGTNLAAGEGVEPSSSSSKPDVLPVAPSRKEVSSFLFRVSSW